MEALQRMHNRGSISTGYDIDNSYKNEADNTERMYRAWGAGGGNSQTFTVSLWVKRTELDTQQYIWGAGTGGTNFFLVSFESDNTMRVRSHVSSSDQAVYITNRIFRDTSAWYHIVTAVDTTSGTAGDRLRIYINGVEETSFSTETNFSQNDSTMHNANSSYMEVGTVIGEANRFCGYISEVISISGSQLAPTTFGEFDSDSNIWIPKEYTGSFPQNSVFLEFKDSSSLGTDTSGNDQTFTLQNITAVDQATDTPTNNFPTLIPMYTPASSCILSEGGLEWDINMPSGSAFNPNTSAMSSFQVSGTNGGKWYIESKITNNNRGFVGIVSSLAFLQQTTDPTEFVYWDFYNGWIGSSLISTETNPPDAAVNTIIGIALDCDNQRVTFSKNGGWLAANGDMTGGSPSDWRWDWTSDANFLDHPNCNGNIAFWCGTQTDANVYRPIHQVNFGGFSPYTISSGNVDENGYGNFEYAVPSGFYALCTKNLAEYG